MINKKSDYQSIFKATTLFGGVQVWKIIIEIAKQKFIAIWLGTYGMGILGLYNSSIQFIQGLTTLGLSQSAVRDVADANSSGNHIKISQTVTALRRLVWITGLLGTFIVIILAPYLSKTAFGNYDYTIPFISLSITLLLQQLSVGQSVILQGLRKLKWLALSGVFGSFFGLLLSIPIYYFFRLQGIVPTIILNAITTLALTYYFSRKIKIPKVEQTAKQTFQEGKVMLKMGIALSFNSVMVLGIGYLTRIFISHLSGTSEVGLYTAGFAIIGGYTGLIFNAMSTDYYPRLASVNKDNAKCTEYINQQGEIAILLITPLILLFNIFAPIVISILYSDSFIGILGYIRYAMVGMIFKASAWAISFVFLAKSDMKIFLFNEISIKILNVPLYFCAYYYWRLDGLGVAFIINYFIYFIICYITAYKNYGFRYNSQFIKLVAVQLFFVILSFLFLNFNGIIYKSISLSIFLACCIFSFKQLNNRVEIFKAIKNKLHIK